MNKLVINISLFSLLSMMACAQSATEKPATADLGAKTETSFDAEEIENEQNLNLSDTSEIENNQNLNLNLSQKDRIREINRNIGARFRAIGRDPYLSGYEKGQKKRELAIQHRREIYEILNSSQRDEWETTYGNHGGSIKDDITDRIEDKIDELEDIYESNKKEIEKNDYLSEVEKKAQIKELKRKFKFDKEKLKREKEDVKNTSLLRGQ